MVEVDVGVFWVSRNGVKVGLTPSTDWFCGVQAATIKIRQKDSSIFLGIGFPNWQRIRDGNYTLSVFV